MSPANRSHQQKRKIEITKKALEYSSDDDSSDSDTEEPLARQLAAAMTADIAQLRCNPHISSMMEVIKPQLRNVIDCCHTIRSWMQLLKPHMQDGNNFGVEVQNEILEYVKR